MSKINGTFLKLHDQVGKFPPQYYNTNEFDRTISLVDCVTEGCSERSDTYKFSSDDEIRSRIGAIDPADKELFFVESNSAHHLSAFLAQSAIDNMPKDDDGKTPGALVVNFDQHDDHGTPGSKLFCGNWSGHVSCDYLVIGLKNKTEAHFYKYGESKYTVYTLEQYKDLFEDYEQIYVTVDMDVLTNGASKRTNWGAGDMTKEKLIELLSDLPGDKLVAADITGFPPNKNGDADELASYINDITDTAKALCNIMGRPLTSDTETQN